MLDRKKVADLRLALIRANMQKFGSNSEGELLCEIRPLFGELLALADAALKIRGVYKQMPVPTFKDAHVVMAKIAVSAMRDLDELEGFSRG